MLHYIKLALFVYALLYPILTGIFLMVHVPNNISSDKYEVVHYKVLAFISGWIIVPYMAIKGECRLSKKTWKNVQKGVDE